jgi:hypothetical protein
MNRCFKDKNSLVTKALPAAAATNYSDSIDLGSTTPGPLVDQLDLLLNLPATPSLVDAKTVTLAFQDSADNSSFAAIPELATVVATGAGGVGAAAIERRVKLPPSVRRYVRISQAVLTAGGDNTAISTTLAVVF